MDLRFFGADHAPAAFGFHAAHGCQSLRHAPAKSIAMRHLIETIRRGDRSDLDGLKENVVAGGHRWIPFLKLKDPKGFRNL